MEWGLIHLWIILVSKYIAPRQLVNESFLRSCQLEDFWLSLLGWKTHFRCTIPYARLISFNDSLKPRLISLWYGLRNSPCIMVAYHAGFRAKISMHVFCWEILRLLRDSPSPASRLPLTTLILLFLEMCCKLCIIKDLKRLDWFPLHDKTSAYRIFFVLT